MGLWPAAGSMQLLQDAPFARPRGRHRTMRQHKPAGIPYIISMHYISSRVAARLTGEDGEGGCLLLGCVRYTARLRTTSSPSG